MLHETEEQARLKRQKSKKAIALAMEGRWREAVAANKRMIESFPNHESVEVKRLESNRSGRNSPIHWTVGLISHGLEATIFLQ